MQRVLVAGATGHLGGFVCQELKARDHLVRALARSPEKLHRLEDSLDENVEAEVTRPETLEHVCDGIDVVLSSIGITRQRDKLSFRDVDYQGNRNLLEVAQRAGVEKFVCVSVFNGPNLRPRDRCRGTRDPEVGRSGRAGLRCSRSAWAAPNWGSWDAITIRRATQ